MVVIEGPRFSTRAESKWYAAQDWAVVNMTGHPEAVLARELALCYATVALVTDHDAGVDEASAVSMDAVFEVFAAHTDTLKSVLAERRRGARHRPRLRVLARRRRHGPAGRAAVRILLTGAAGFIGTHIGRIARERGHEVVALDMFLDKAHGPGERPPGFEQLDLRSARLDDVLDGIDVVCHQAAMVGNGVDAQDLPDYAEHNDAGTARLLAAMARAASTDLVLASSMVVYGDGRYTCPEHGDVPPAPRREDDLSAGRYDPRCPVCGGDITWRRIAEDTPVPAAHELCRVEDRAGALRLGVVHARGLARRSR